MNTSVTKIMTITALVVSLSAIAWPHKAASADKPFTRAELIEYMRTHVTKYMVDWRRHKTDIDKVCEVVAARGVDFGSIDYEINSVAGGSDGNNCSLSSVVNASYLASLVSPMPGDASQGPPFSRSDLIEFMRKHVLHYSADFKRHAEDIDAVCEVIAHRGVDFRLAGFDAELHNAAGGTSGRSCSLHSAIEKAYLANAKPDPVGAMSPVGPPLTLDEVAAYVQADSPSEKCNIGDAKVASIKEAAKRRGVAFKNDRATREKITKWCRSYDYDNALLDNYGAPKPVDWLFGPWRTTVGGMNSHFETKGGSVYETTQWVVAKSGTVTLDKGGTYTWVEVSGNVVRGKWRVAQVAELRRLPGVVLIDGPDGMDWLVSETRNPLMRARFKNAIDLDQIGSPIHYSGLR